MTVQLSEKICMPLGQDRKKNVIYAKIFGLSQSRCLSFPLSRVLYKEDKCNLYQDVLFVWFHRTPLQAMLTALPVPRSVEGSHLEFKQHSDLK